MLDGLIQRPACEAQGRRTHRRAEYIQGGHGDIEPLAAFTHQTVAGNAAIIKPQRGKRVGCAQVDACGHLESRRVGINYETAQPSGTGDIFCSCKNGVEIGDIAVGDPGFDAVKHKFVALLFGGGRQGGHIRAGLGFGQGKGGELLTAAYR